MIGQRILRGNSPKLAKLAFFKTKYLNERRNLPNLTNSGWKYLWYKNSVQKNLVKCQSLSEEKILITNVPSFLQKSKQNISKYQKTTEKSFVASQPRVTCFNLLALISCTLHTFNHTLFSNTRMRYPKPVITWHKRGIKLILFKNWLSATFVFGLLPTIFSSIRPFAHENSPRHNVLIDFERAIFGEKNVGVGIGSEFDLLLWFGCCCVFALCFFAAACLLWFMFALSIFI